MTIRWRIPAKSTRRWILKIELEAMIQREDTRGYEQKLICFSHISAVCR